MRILLLGINELEIIKSALECDINFQKKQLKEIGNDIRFEMWLDDTQLLHKRISTHLMEMKANI